MTLFSKETISSQTPFHDIDFISYDFDKNTTSHSQQHLKRNYDYMMVILQNLYRDDFTLDGFSV